MSNPENADQLIEEKNFLTEGVVVADPSSDIYTFNYHYLTSENELTYSLGYDLDEYDSDGAGEVDTGVPNIEYTEFSSLNQAQQDAFTLILNAPNAISTSVFFSDVVENIAFNSSSALNADINIGQVLWENGNGNPNDDDDLVLGYTKQYYNSSGDGTVEGYPHSKLYGEASHGDIWLNSNFAFGWGNIEFGKSQFEGTLHELVPVQKALFLANRASCASALASARG